jgi:WD40 repeat protein
MFRNPFHCITTLVFLGLASSSAVAQTPQVLVGHTNVVSAIAFTNDGRQVISASWDETLRVWDVAAGRHLKTLTGHRDWVLDVVVPDEKRLLSVSQHTVRIWNAASFEEEQSFAGLGGASVSAATLSDDGKLLAIGGRDGTVQLWNVGDSKPSETFGGFRSWVNTVSFAPNGKTLTAGSRTGRIKIFDVKDGTERATLEAHGGKQVLALAINPSSDTLASGGFDSTVQLWDLATGKEQAKLSGHKGVVTAVAWSADGRRLASGERHGHIKLWDTNAANRLITTLAGHFDKRLGFSVTALAFSPDGHRLASGGYDKSVKLWKLSEE